MRCEILITTSTFHLVRFFRWLAKRPFRFSARKIFAQARRGRKKELREALDDIPGAQLERKRFSVAAHYRNVNENDVPRVERAVAEVTARRRELRRIDGKKVFELVPDIEWNKGKAVLLLLETLGLEGGTCARFTSAMIALTRTLSAPLGNAA